jgi:methyl-accepting chemotaxis protein
MELYIPITFGETNTPWSILIKVPMNAIMSAAGDLRSNMERMTVDSLIILVVISSIVILAGLFVLFLLVRSITIPIRKATNQVINISKGIVKKENLKIKIKR